MINRIAHLTCCQRDFIWYNSVDYLSKHVFVNVIFSKCRQISTSFKNCFASSFHSGVTLDRTKLVKENELEGNL